MSPCQAFNETKKRLFAGALQVCFLVHVEERGPPFPRQSTAYLPAKQRAAQTIAFSSSFRFTPLSPLSFGASRVSNIPPVQKRSHSHLNLYSHVQHTRDYECVGLMKPGEGVCLCTTEQQPLPLTTTATPRVTRLSSPSLQYICKEKKKALIFSPYFSSTFSVSHCISGCSFPGM